MIKFFRKIRQKLLSENKLRKYLLYAVGEIILVVIGILIALQLNTWKENQQLQSIKQEYLSQLLIDLEKETQNVNDNLAFLKNNIELYEAYINRFDSTSLQPSEIVHELTKVNPFTKTLIFNTNTFETLKATGEITLLSTTLRNKLIELNRYQNYLDEIYRRDFTIYIEDAIEAQKLGLSDPYNRLRTKPELIDYLDKHLNLEMQQAKTIIEFESIYSYKNNIEKRTIRLYERLLSDIEEIKNLIELEIE